MSILARLGLDRRELRAWVMYDWANSAFQTTVITAVFPNFFSRVAAASPVEGHAPLLTPAEATAVFGWGTTICLTFIAILGPILGAIADYRAIKKKMLAAFMTVGVITTAAMATIDRGEWQWALALFMIANVAIAASFVFYDSLLPDSVSAIQLSFVSVAVWWFVFSIPLFRGVPEPARALQAGERADENPIVAAFGRLRGTLGELRGYRNAFLMLL